MISLNLNRRYKNVLFLFLFLVLILVATGINLVKNSRTIVLPPPPRGFVLRKIEPEVLMRRAKQGDAEAQRNLGFLYHKGQGVPQDYAEARKWWLRAAKQGNYNAQHSLGFLYFKGQGVPVDYVTSFAWASAAARGAKDAEEFRDLVYNKLGLASLGRAQELSREYFKLYVEPFQ